MEGELQKGNNGGFKQKHCYPCFMIILSAIYHLGSNVILEITTHLDFISSLDSRTGPAA